MFKIEVLMFQSKANLDEKILFVKVAVEKFLQGACMETRTPYFVLVHDLLFIEVEILFLK